MKGYNWK